MTDFHGLLLVPMFCALVAVAVGPGGAFHISDTDTGRSWREIYTGENTPVKKNHSPAVVGGQAAMATDGKIPSSKIKMFTLVCSVCHMVDG